MKEMISERDELLNRINGQTFEIEQNQAMDQGSETSEPDVDRGIMENQVRTIAADVANADAKQKRIRKKKNEMVRNFTCSIDTCEKTYATENSLNQHMRNKHPEEYQTWKLTHKSAEKPVNYDDSQHETGPKESQFESEMGKPAKQFKVGSMGSREESEGEDLGMIPETQVKNEHVTSSEKLNSESNPQHGCSEVKDLIEQNEILDIGVEVGANGGVSEIELTKEEDGKQNN